MMVIKNKSTHNSSKNNNNYADEKQQSNQKSNKQYKKPNYQKMSTNDEEIDINAIRVGCLTICCYHL